MDVLKGFGIFKDPNIWEGGDGPGGQCRSLPIPVFVSMEHFHDLGRSQDPSKVFGDSFHAFGDGKGEYPSILQALHDPKELFLIHSGLEFLGVSPKVNTVPRMNGDSLTHELPWRFVGAQLRNPPSNEGRRMR